ncbi:hypothetical protein MSC49_19010 [Methylosinus sp. C49]|nr:hypothetical protein MSC49_19010 [Methylosinus sp. C49]
MDDALGGRHEGEHALRPLLKIDEIGRGVADAEHAQPGVILPAGPRHAPEEAQRHLTERRSVKIPQVDDVERHICYFAFIYGATQARETVAAAIASLTLSVSTGAAQ